MKLFKLALLVLPIFMFGSSISQAQCPKLVWADEFDGTTLDLQKWTHQLGGGGWGNNELQNYRPENTTLENGLLKITAKRENFSGNAYTSSRIRSINKGDFTYGRMEARIKLPYGQGIWPAFWMMPTDDKYGTWPKSGELDIMEFIGREPKIIYGTIHFGPDWPNNKSSGGAYDAYREDFSKEYHTYAVEWEPNEIRWYIDDFLYSTKRPTDVAPERWPFDQRFHFILNLAVGGTWPGSPDGSTVFPQVLEVDYVRVYDTRTQSLSGPRSVPFKAPFTVYTINGSSSGDKITWEVPAGAEITSGQGTSNLAIKWGSTGGEVKANIENVCGKKEVKVYVRVEPGIAKEKALENFDDASPLKLVYYDGTFADNFANPAKTGINTTSLVGKYTRSGSTQYDVLIYEGNPISDLGPYVQKQRKFFLDVYTNAAIGTEVLFQAENSARAKQSYPSGRHSRYQGFTTKQNEWERMELIYLDRPDAGTSASSVDRYVLLFKPNTFSNNIYHFDNLDSYAPQLTGVRDALVAADQVFRLSPNPGRNELRLENIGTQNLVQATLLGLDGKILQTHAVPILPAQIQEFNVRALPLGSYFLQVLRADGKVAVRQWVKGN
ncbi:family 16 glycosylhydrolase [Haliscomenobacter hydrossis]|uniref:Glucan endo-1,3-beta-D-glucosidase n=1 Tax=Haliscomenobacter hydrossis (strain ATCC 27775 / DSM 1100 / LMG 10767 / O) TaxID=760192 RepID=F4L2N4_HALH1|nr:family 16 glycosylhydrolase [Haliscomenobacter hydrossis]AEE48598.1 Glucan endo-1,3-beta-D-glucosidase [Haliscomenobacter hydrossis DSM 1100]